MAKTKKILPKSLEMLTNMKMNMDSLFFRLIIPRKFNFSKSFSNNFFFFIHWKNRKIIIMMSICISESLKQFYIQYY